VLDRRFRVLALVQRLFFPILLHIKFHGGIRRQLRPVSNCPGLGCLRCSNEFQELYV
jgi:hypothetical protein